MIQPIVEWTRKQRAFRDINDRPRFLLAFITGKRVGVTREVPRYGLISVGLNDPLFREPLDLARGAAEQLGEHIHVVLHSTARRG